ncbi:ATP-dependent helicase HepA [Anatilimnocola aggregata]|uniref:ATP-dependent helicase HepA n=1 Tax=Anatilimnocola aggregata TaxID=2528021 RepID=A0A517YBF2_9BACT|nr:ATP-dependent helicase HepA [Anatilimnocola aggregata]
MDAMPSADHSLSLTTSDLSLPVDTFALGWQAALTRAPKIDTELVDFSGQQLKVIALKIPRTLPRVYSFTFPECPSFFQPPLAKEAKPAKAEATTAETVEEATTTEETGESNGEAKKLTRIKPPGDIVKLEDRLYYVLQPPLESLVKNGSLTFPFEPFPYQFQGIAFMYPRYTAVLADEMGLGKTMQAITTIRMLVRAGEIRNCLLVCPKPLVTNWRREFQTWAPEIPINIVEGDSNKRRWQWTEATAPVTIANYELLMRDRDVLDSGLHFDLVVLDEAQRIKNVGATTSEIVRSISRTRSWALTGTPIENRPDDLVGIFEFLSPGYLQTGLPAKKLAELVRDHIIRRTKDMVLTDMPPKMFRDADIDLTPEQWATYKMAEDEGVINLNAMGDQITVQNIFELVLRLKQICNFDPLTGASAKLERLEADMEEVAASGKKAIVFSQWTKTIDQMKPALARFNPLEYHGKIPSAKRDPILKEFKENKDRHMIIMSYGAGSVGLNLQFCEYVFLFDRWWNPAIEDQAINRAHRIGAKGAVTVTRMLAMNTIEERINEVLAHKRELFAAVIDQTGGASSAGLNQSDIFGLFKLRTPKGPIKAAA